jgi:hypothetical protein
MMEEFIAGQDIEGEHIDSSHEESIARKVASAFVNR